jgi:hypothetical protein
MPSEILAALLDVLYRELRIGKYAERIGTQARTVTPTS